MKKWRKIPVLLLAAVMICSLAGTALAVDKKEYADTAGHWAEEEMNRVIELGLMDGRTETAFAPNENITRAELVMALHRLDGSPSLPGGKHENPFSDVSTDDACWEAVMWASDHGIVKIGRAHV